MKITKFGHCCLLIEERGLRILTDPGSYTTAQNEVKNIDVVLITHEHGDHLHIESLKKVISNTKKLIIITNKGVAKLLDKEGINYELVEHGQKIEIKGVLIEGYGEKHAEIYKTLPSVINTGYFISNKLFYPGDALYNPGKAVDVLALPIVGPWMKFSEAIDYALSVKPNSFFGVHEGILKDADFGKRLIQNAGNILSQHNIKLISLEEGKETEV